MALVGLVSIEIDPGHTQPLRLSFVGRWSLPSMGTAEPALDTMELVKINGVGMVVCERV